MLLEPIPFTLTRARRSGTDCVAASALLRRSFRGRAALWQGQVQISWQAQHFRKVRCSFHGRAALWHCLEQISPQARHSRKARGQFVGGASHGEGVGSWQARHFRKGEVQVSRPFCKVWYRLRGNRTTSLREQKNRFDRIQTYR